MTGQAVMLGAGWGIAPAVPLSRPPLEIAPKPAPKPPRERRTLEDAQPGQRFGDWTVIREIDPAVRKNRHGNLAEFRQFVLRCKCGYEATKELGYILRSKSCRSCHCKRIRKVMGLPGEVVNSWTIVQELEPTPLLDASGQTRQRRRVRATCAGCGVSSDRTLASLRVSRHCFSCGRKKVSAKKRRKGLELHPSGDQAPRPCWALHPDFSKLIQKRAMWIAFAESHRGEGLEPGTKLGRWTVIREAEPLYRPLYKATPGGGGLEHTALRPVRRWLVRCECGFEAAREHRVIKKGKGCHACGVKRYQERRAKEKLKPMTELHGWPVVRELDSAADGGGTKRRYVRVICPGCGKELTKPLHALKQTKQCMKCAPKYRKKRTVRKKN